MKTVRRLTETEEDQRLVERFTERRDARVRRMAAPAWLTVPPEERVRIKEAVGLVRVGALCPMHDRPWAACGSCVPRKGR